MKKKHILATLSCLLLLGGCSSSSSNDNSTSTQQEHPVLTMTTRQTSDYHAFLEALHQVYPEINIQLQSYAGYNTTQYAITQLEAGDISDIFVMSYAPSAKLQQDNLLDLSSEEFISNINAKSLSDLAIDGSVYILPTSMSIIGCYYNKTLFEEHGWSVPTSMEELEALIPQIEAAGVKISEMATQFDGTHFSQFFDINAPEFFSSLQGITWMSDYLNGTATAKGNIEECVERYQHLIDIGLLNIGETPLKDSDTTVRFKEEGNAAFYVTTGSLGFSQNSDGTGDQYGLMPYLSQDGSNNIIVATPGMYIGISKKVADDPAKLEDALKVMSFVASSQGQKALATNANQVSPIAGDSVDESSPLYEMAKLVDQGQYMGMVYSGWEDYVVGIGQKFRQLLAGETTTDEVVEYMDELAKDVQANGLVAIAQVEETLEKQQVAQLVGAAFAQATGADCALISIGDYHVNTELDEDGHAQAGYENPNGINAKIYAGVTLDASNTLSTFNPIAAAKSICLMTLTGKEIKQFVEEGYFNKEADTTPFEYILVTKQGMELDDDTTYTVACTGESEQRAAQGNLVESDVASKDALVSYIEKIGVINSQSIIWK